MLYTIGEIVKRFRTEGACYKFKPQTITYMAKKLGYSPKRIGGKIGYDSSLMTAISRHFKEAVEYDKGLGVKVSQKLRKQPNMGDYYTYNGERDNVDYDWEKNEGYSIMNKVIITEGQEIINNLSLAVELVQKQWESEDDYWYVSICQRRKDNGNVIDDNGMSIFSGKLRKTKNGHVIDNIGWEDGDSSKNKIGYVVVRGKTLDEAINCLLNPTVIIFESWKGFFGGKKQISSNDRKMSSIIRVCRMFNARAYFSSYKKSYSALYGTDPHDLRVTKPIIALRGKNDPISRERVFDFVSTRKAAHNLPIWFVDCDDEGEEINRKVSDYIKSACGVEPRIYKSHGGVHYLIDMSHYFSDKKGRSIANNIVKNLRQFFYSLYGNQVTKGIKRGKNDSKQQNPIELDMGYNIILYSEAGVKGRNISHPEWQKNLNYPVPDLRQVKLAVKESIEYFLNEEFKSQNYDNIH